MSYHDGYIQPKMAGHPVINPLILIERKLGKIKKLLADADEMEDITAAELKAQIEGILRE
jgi:hypothetical protein